MQGFSQPISTANKAKYLTQLLKVGFDTIDFASFVSPKAVPQMADTEDLIDLVDFSKSESKLLAIIANQRGFKKAQTFSEIDFLGFPLSISESFQERNTNSSIAKSYELIDYMLKEIENQELVVYLSMAFGNPYNDDWSLDILMKNAQELINRGITTLSLADTIGLASPIDIYRIFDKLICEFPKIEFGAHFHSRPENWSIKIQAAYDAGCKRFDTAILGLGGCPFADDELIGNTSSENFVEWLRTQHALPKFNLQEFEKAIILAKSIFNV